jgi:hypothetical protein
MVAMPTLVAEASLVREVGGFDDAQVYGEFQDLALRLSLRAQAWAVDEALCLIRHHSDHFSGNRIAALTSWMRLYEKMQALAPTRPLQAYCAWMRAQTSLAVSSRQMQERQPGAACSTLIHSLPFSWRYPRWWFGAARSLVRGLVEARS